MIGDVIDELGQDDEVLSSRLLATRLQGGSGSVQQLQHIPESRADLTKVVETTSNFEGVLASDEEDRIIITSEILASAESTKPPRPSSSMKCRYTIDNTFINARETDDEVSAVRLKASRFLSEPPRARNAGL
jgi:hypothetical protein